MTVAVALGTNSTRHDEMQTAATSYPVAISLDVAEDYYLGDARFIVLADGVQIGGVQTATTTYGAGWQTISLFATLNDAPSVVSVQFINDAWGGSKTLDRNLYVQSLTMNGIIFQGVTALNQAGGSNKPDAASLHTDGAISFTTAITAPPPPSLFPEAITVSVSEDAYLGNAQFVVLADGVQIGGVETAVASHAADQWQSVAVSAELARAPSTIQIKFINDAWGGTPALDRNLYVKTLQANGTLYEGFCATNQASGSAGGSDDALYTDGTITFNVAAGPPPIVAPTDQLVILANEYVTVGDVVQFDRTQAWSMTTTIDVAQSAPGPSDGLPDGGAELIFGNTNGAPYAGYEAWIDDQGHLRVREMSNFLAGNYIDVTGKVDIADGQPHFIGVSYDGSSTAAGITLYVDGQAQQTLTLANNLTGSTLSGGPLIIGNQLNGWQNQFELAGSMSTFSISNVARPASYFLKSQLPPVDAATQIAFSFASNTGQQVTDLSGHSNTGTLSTPDMWKS